MNIADYAHFFEALLFPCLQLPHPAVRTYICATKFNGVLLSPLSYVAASPPFAAPTFAPPAARNWLLYQSNFEFLETNYPLLLEAPRPSPLFFSFQKSDMVIIRKNGVLIEMLWHML